MKKLAVVFIAFAFAACGKSDETPPVVNVLTPTDHQVFTDGQTVNVKAEISDDEGLHMVHLMVIDNSGLHVDHFEEHLDARTYTLNRSFTAHAGKTYTITVGATDHNDNTVDKNLIVSVN